MVLLASLIQSLIVILAIQDAQARVSRSGIHANIAARSNLRRFSALRQVSRRSHDLPSLPPASPDITSGSYTRLTSLLPSALQNGMSITQHSWEIGILSNSLTEVYYTDLAPFDFAPSNDSAAPYPVMDIILNMLSSYDWTGSPSSLNATDSNLSDYLSYPDASVPNVNETLVDGDGALGDPASTGTATWITAQFLSQATVKAQYPDARPAEDYAWAVGNQYLHLESGVRDNTGTISQREGYYELWADMGYMIPPFLAYIGLATSNQSMLGEALDQWTGESNELYNVTDGVYNHIPDWDNRPWATGNGWMLMGFARVVASINAAGLANTFSDKVQASMQTAATVFNDLFDKMTAENLIPNYMTGNGTGDAAGSAMIAAAYYRFRVLSGASYDASLDQKASDLFDAVVSKLSDDGWLQQVVNPFYPWTVYNGTSPEGQSALGLMWAARTAGGH